jgi:glutathione S-transferase
MIDINNLNYGFTGGKLIPEFGFVIVVGMIAFVLNYLKVISVIAARKKYNIKAPQMTETRKDDKGEFKQVPEEYLCAQRAHLNNVENFPIFLMLLIFAGIGYPVYAAAAGFEYQFFKYIGAYNYATKGAKKRGTGALFHLGEVTLFILSGMTAYNLIMSI